jgi:hypothetical protein
MAFRNNACWRYQPRTMARIVGNDRRWQRPSFLGLDYFSASLYRSHSTDCRPQPSEEPDSKPTLGEAKGHVFKVCNDHLPFYSEKRRRAFSELLAAKENVRSAERLLEEVSAQLEKRQHTRDHEEQTWSDTIRRNSTWITLGLLASNTFILLVSVVILEPQRERGIVPDTRTTVKESAAALQIPQVETQSPVKYDASVASEASARQAALTWETRTIDKTLGLSEPRASFDDSFGGPNSAHDGQAPAASDAPARTVVSGWATNAAETATGLIRGLLSDRIISLRIADLTIIVVNSAAAGAGIMAAMIVLLLPLE